MRTSTMQLHNNYRICATHFGNRSFANNSKNRLVSHGTTNNYIKLERKSHTTQDMHLMQKELLLKIAVLQDKQRTLVENIPPAAESTLFAMQTRKPRLNSFVPEATYLLNLLWKINCLMWNFLYSLCRQIIVLHLLVIENI